MTLKCSAEPKRRDVAQITVFAAESEPLWRNTPRGKKAVCGIVQRRDTLKSLYLTAAFLYALRGASYGITSKEGRAFARLSHSITAETAGGLRCATIYFLMGVIDLKRKKGSAPVSRALIRRPLRRWFPLFMGPVVCAFIIGFVYPFCKGVYLSFCKFKTTSDAEFIGLGNYVKALQDASFM